MKLSTLVLTTLLTNYSMSFIIDKDKFQFNNIDSRKENLHQYNIGKRDIDNNTTAPALNQIECPMDNIIIERTSDLSILDHCNTINNDLIVTQEFADNIIDLRSLQTIKGHFIVEDCSDLIKIRAPHLESIKGNFILTSLTSLVMLELSNLIEVNSIEWKILPILNQIDVNPNIMVKQNIIISDTSISNLDGFKQIKKLDTFNINNNRFLETIRVGLSQVNNQCTIHANSKDLTIELPFLTKVENMTIRDAQSVWLPNLKTVNTNLEFIENGFIEIDLITLESVGGTLGIIDNQYLSNFKFNNLTDIQGGLMIDNNPKLDTIDTFNTLKTIGGAIHFDGSFKDTDFPNLKLVKGSAYIKTTSDEMDCNKWIRPQNGRSIIRGGKIKCSSPKKHNLISLDENGKIIDVQENDIVNGKPNIEVMEGTATSLKWPSCAIFLTIFTLIW
ncbi:sporulation-specific protein 2 [Monosporozyma servazzii]